MLQFKMYMILAVFPFLTVIAGNRRPPLEIERLSLRSLKFKIYNLATHMMMIVVVTLLMTIVVTTLSHDGDSCSHFG